MILWRILPVFFVAILGIFSAGRAEATCYRTSAGACIGKYPTLFAMVVGRTLPPAKVRARGPVFQRYEDDFLRFNDTHWVTDGARWDAANYYDRAAINYVCYARTLNSKCLERANALALDYRVNYLEPNNYGPSSHWSQMKGVTLHYAMTGDPMSLRAVGRVADAMASPYMMKNLSSKVNMDGRVQARTLTAFLYAWVSNAPRLGTRENARVRWSKFLRVALDRILSTQEADGSYRFAAWKYKVSPYQIGILNDALIEYYTIFERDPRIPLAIRKSIDFLWANTWDTASQSFLYIERGHPESVPAPDLNNLISSGFGWTYRATRLPVYKARGDAVFAGGVRRAWLVGSKQFNQAYYSSYKYLERTEPWAK